MDVNDSFELLMQQINGLDRAGCMRELRRVPHLRLDFSDEFLARQSLDQLRHLLMAATLQARRHLRDTA